MCIFLPIYFDRMCFVFRTNIELVLNFWFFVYCQGGNRTYPIGKPT